MFKIKDIAICVNCGDKFARTKSDRKYCDVICSAQAAEKRKKEKKVDEKAKFEKEFYKFAKSHYNTDGTITCINTQEIVDFVFKFFNEDK